MNPNEQPPLGCGVFLFRYALVVAAIGLVLLLAMAAR